MDKRKPSEGSIFGFGGRKGAPSGKRIASGKGKHVRKPDGGNSPTTARLDVGMLAVVIFCAAIVPLIVYLKAYDLVGVQITAWTGGDEHIDFFNWWKAMALILGMLVLLTLHVLRRFASSERMEVPRLFLPLLLFEGFALLSAVSSAVPEIAFPGFPDRSEGLWVLFAYGVLAYSAFCIARREARVRVVLVATFCGSLVVSVIGLFQFLGMDFFQTSLGKHLMLPKAFERFADQLTFNFGSNIMYTTVYNPNYLGSYASLLLPVAISLMLVWAGEGKRALPGYSLAALGKRWRWIIGLLFSLSVFVLYLGSMSRAGLIGGIAAMALFLVLQGKTIARRAVPALCLVLLFVGCYLFMDNVSGGLVSNEFRQTLPSSVQVALGQVPVSEDTVATPAAKEFAAPSAAEESQGAAADTASPQSAAPGADAQATGAAQAAAIPAVPPQVRAVRLGENRFRFETGTETLEIVLEKAKDGTIRCYDGKSSELKLTGQDGRNGVRRFADERYAAYTITVNGNQYDLQWYTFRFLLSNENGVLTYTPKPRTYWTDAEPAPHVGFDGHERFATNRGWIWSRTLPILGKAIIAGYGPDTFAVYFPQKDIAWKMNLYGAANIVVDKPHNWYLQTAVNTGVVSLLLLLWLLGAFLLDGLRAVRGRPVRGMARWLGQPVAGDPMASMAETMVPADGPTACFTAGEAEENRKLLLSGILCGVLGYALAGIFNDSVVSVAPVFWIVFGLGVGLLRFAPRVVVPVQDGAAKKSRRPS